MGVTFLSVGHLGMVNGGVTAFVEGNY